MINNSVTLHPDQHGVNLRNQTAMVMDATGYDKRQAGFLLQTLAVLEKQRPDLPWGKIPFPMLVEFLKQLVPHINNKHALDESLGARPPANLDNVLPPTNQVNTPSPSEASHG